MPWFPAFVCCFGAALSLGRIPAPNASVQEAAPPSQVAFEDLTATPELWLGETVQTVVQVRGASAERWEGFLSGLSPRTHVALDVWSDTQLLWDAEDFHAPAGRLYVPVSVLVGEALRSLQRPTGVPATFERHTRALVTVRVVAYTAGRGWLEVQRIEPTAEQVPEGTVLHAIRGLDLVRQGVTTLAVSELEKALRPRLPQHIRAALEAELQRARSGAQSVSTVRKTGATLAASRS